jgi:adenine-specific DNA-methyltransferase
MELLIHNIRDVNLTSSILAELLLKSGFDLCAKCERISIAGSEVFSIQDGSLLVCLEKVISKELVNQMATLCPIRVICLDSGFAGNDQLKVNAVETFKAKGITFKTV